MVNSEEFFAHYNNKHAREVKLFKKGLKKQILDLHKRPTDYDKS